MTEKTVSLAPSAKRDVAAFEAALLSLVHSFYDADVSYTEMVGTLELVKHEVALEAVSLGDADER